MRGPPPSPERPMILREVAGRIDEVFRTLTPREAEILKLRYGLGPDGGRYTVAEVGRIYKVTRARVCSIEQRALGRLRDTWRKYALEGYLELLDQIRRSQDVAKHPHEEEKKEPEPAPHGHGHAQAQKALAAKGGGYVVTFHGQQPCQVEAGSPEEAIKAAQEKLGVVAWERPPEVAELK